MKSKIPFLLALFLTGAFTLSAQTTRIGKAPSSISKSASFKIPKLQKRVIVLLDKKGDRIDGLLPVLDTSVELKRKYPKNRFFIGMLKTNQKLSRRMVNTGDHVVLFTDTEFFPGDNFVVVENGFFPGDHFLPGDQFRKQGIRSVEVLKKEAGEVQLLLK